MNDITRSDEHVIPGDVDEQSLVELFIRHRSRLRRMVHLRLDQRIQGRVDPSDVLQEAQIDILRRAGEYVANPTMTPFLWLRFLTAQRLTIFHRHHLGAKARDAGQEVSIYRGALPEASSVSLAAMLLGRLTSPTQAAHRAEMKLRLQESLNGMDPIDREVLTLRHFEELSNAETAEVLGISKTAACNRYFRALKRLKEILSGMPGFFTR
ncbi:sigma-70 family RNA polymerase sigma factor [Isosphaeraceae bacterium EP7]